MLLVATDFVSACFLQFSVFYFGGWSTHNNFSTNAAICALGERGDNRNNITEIRIRTTMIDSILIMLFVLLKNVSALRAAFKQ